MIDFINLTPHALSVLLPDGSTITFQPSGTVARVTTEEVVVGETGGIPLVERRFGAVQGLPEEGVPCLVSALVAGAVPGRAGVYAPDTGVSAVRNEKGHVVAVTRLVKA